MIYERMNEAIREVPDFPKPGILFKDITPIFQDAQLCRDILDELTNLYKNLDIDVIIGIESRGFFFGLPLAMSLNVPFAPVRKKGKLPHDTIGYAYTLEYGTAEIEIHSDVLNPGDKVLIHDDLLATGGTARAAAELCKMQDAEVVGFSFLLDLPFLNGREKIESYCRNISILAAR